MADTFTACLSIWVGRPFYLLWAIDSPETSVEERLRVWCTACLRVYAAPRVQVCASPLANLWCCQMDSPRGCLAAVKVMSLGLMTFTAAITREDDWFVARCLEVEVTSQGRSVEEAQANLKEALELYFEDQPLPADIEPPIIAPVELTA
jgi:predicted RNase H-like HicB family nuclease